jgi:hypothetical protein
MEKPEEALSGWDRDGLASGTRAENGRSPPVRRDATLGRGEQHQRDRRGRRAHVLLVHHEVPGQCRGGDDERRGTLELPGLLLAGGLL